MVTEEEMNEFDDVKEINDRIQSIQLQKKKLIEEESKLNYIKCEKFKNYNDRDSLLFLGGSKDGSFQVFCEKKSAEILAQASYLLFDGSWGATPLFSTKCKKRNHFRMEWTINACFANPDDEQAPLTVKCASILFAKDKPSAMLYQNALRFLVKRCNEEFHVVLFEEQESNLFVMADFEKAMRNAILDVISHAKLMGCWFHYCKCITTKISDLKLMKLYKRKDDRTFYKFMRGFLMLALLPKHLIKDTFGLLVQLAAANVPSDYSTNFEGFVNYMKRTWIGAVNNRHGIYMIDEWCVHGSWIRTNNPTEAMNFVTNQTFGKHPLYHDWIGMLAFQMALHINKYERYQLWQKTNRRKPKEVLKNNLLNKAWKQIACDESPLSIMTFLSDCSKAMKVSNETLTKMLNNYSCKH